MVARSNVRLLVKMYVKAISHAGLILFFVGAFFGGSEIYAMALGSATEAKVVSIIPRCAVSDQTTSHPDMLHNGGCDEVPKLQASHPGRHPACAVPSTGARSRNVSLRCS